MNSFIAHLVLCIVSISPLLAAGSNNYGLVRDKETLRPLTGALVTSTSTGDTQITDSTGRFLLPSAAVRLQRSFPLNGSNIRWNARTRILDVSDVPDLVTVRLYGFDGKLLVCFHPSATHHLLTIPPLPHGIYLVKVGTPWRETCLKIMQYDGYQSWISSTPVRSVSKRASAGTDTLVFSKELYRTKRVLHESDSTYIDFTVNLSPEIGDYLFLDTLRTYRLTIAENDMNILQDYSSLSSGPGQTNPVYVPAHLSFEDRELDSIAVRFRGDQSLWDCITNGSRNVLRYPQFGFGNDDVCAKFAFKFNFKYYKDDQRLYGLKNINFRSMSYDPTKMHERLAFSFFHDMDIVAPRTAFARLYVNNEYWGIFTAIEEIDGRMTKHRFPESGDGNLYKDLWPDSLTSDAMILDALRTNEEEGNIEDFKAFRNAVASPSTADSNFIEILGQQMDIPYLIRYMAVDRAIMNFDGLVSLYCGTNWRLRHNFSWYRDLPGSKFILIPWDMDKVFLYPEPNFWTNNQPTGNNTVPNWNVVTSDYTPIGCYFDPSTIAVTYLGSGPYYDVSPIDADKFLRLFRTTTWNDFVTEGHRFLDEVFLQDTVDARLTRWRRQIASAVGEDPTIDSTAWETMVDSLSNTIPLMREHFELMLDTLILLSE
ncbi:MAG: CotH kinase family protein [Chitinispirillaceae bacterium]|nr:CotH kinase family protein [Chitinispirillaceae bacterium]